MIKIIGKYLDRYKLNNRTISVGIGMINNEYYMNTFSKNRITFGD